MYKNSRAEGPRRSCAQWFTRGRTSAFLCTTRVCARKDIDASSPSVRLIAESRPLIIFPRQLDSKPPRLLGDGSQFLHPKTTSISSCSVCDGRRETTMTMAPREREGPRCTCDCSRDDDGRWRQAS